MYAVINSGGKQHKVCVGDVIRLEKLEAEAGSRVRFDKVLLTVLDNETKIGQPYVDGACVDAEVVRQARARKKIVFRYHSKTRYRKKKGHRQHFTEVKITAIK